MCRSLANETHWSADRQAMEAGGCLLMRRKLGEKLMERDQITGIASDRWRGSSRHFVEDDYANSDPSTRPAKHLLQPDIEEQ
jgi:hypothetical protein